MRFLLFHYIFIVILVFWNIKSIHGIGKFYNVQETSNKYYIEFENKLNWFESQLACLDLNMTLAELDTYEKSLEIVTLLETAEKHNANDRFYVWMGGILQGDFVWLSTGKIFNYTNWYGDNPDFWKEIEYCAELTSPQNWKWNDDDCFEKRGFICEHVHKEQRLLENSLQQELENHLIKIAKKEKQEEGMLEILHDLDDLSKTSFENENLEVVKENQKKDILYILQQLNGLQNKKQQQLLYSFLEERKLQMEKNLEIDKTRQTELEKQQEIQQQQIQEINELRDKQQQLETDLKNTFEKNLKLQEDLQISENFKNKNNELQKQLETEINLKKSLQKEVEIQQEQIEHFKNQLTTLENSLISENNKFKNLQKQQKLKQTQLEASLKNEIKLKNNLQKTLEELEIKNKKQMEILVEELKNLGFNLEEHVERLKEENLEMKNKIKQKDNEQNDNNLNNLKQPKYSVDKNLLKKLSNITDENGNLFLVYSPYSFYFNNNQ